MNKKGATAKELAEHFGVSQRTIYRDIDTLSLAGIPVYTEKGKGGGIGLQPEFVLNKSILSEQEQNEILTALQGLISIKTSASDQILNKLSMIFNKNTVKWLEVDFSGWGFDDNNIFQDFKTAILEKRIVEFEYFGSSGGMTYRQIEPVQLWFKSKTWYVRGFCLTRNGMRTFRLTRIKNQKVTDKYFPERNPEEIISKEKNEETEKKILKIKLKIAPQMFYRMFDDFGVYIPKKQKDESYTVTLNIPENDWIYNIILSYGEFIEVLSPKHVQNTIKEKSRKIYQKYL
ncbi:MAG: YafY family transcriptional regulator [Treponema sp.]|nr:YafY family transcriptional regulator [Treponema sp.]MCL2271467.1 YafY family transcriptional regulator [Treponema sp.]